MNSMQYAYLYTLTFITFLGIDFIWLGLIAKNFYAKHLGFIMGPVNFPPAIVFYLLYCAGIIIFAVKPALDTGGFTRGVLLGGLFGMMCYATYDLSNLATIKNWPLIVVVVDIIWGTVLSMMVAAISFLIAKRLVA